jgi:hypothetical protein
LTGPRGRAAGTDDYCRVRQAHAQLEKAQARAAAAARDNDTGNDTGTGTGTGKGKEKGKKPVGNITDPDSRLMPVRGGGFIQGYNPQNVTSQDRLVIATGRTMTIV